MILIIQKSVEKIKPQQLHSRFTILVLIAHSVILILNFNNLEQKLKKKKKSCIFKKKFITDFVWKRTADKIFFNLGIFY